LNNNTEEDKINLNKLSILYDNYKDNELNLENITKDLIELNEKVDNKFEQASSEYNSISKELRNNISKIIDNEF